MCSTRPCATPFGLFGKYGTYFEEPKEEESSLKYFQMSDCSHFAVLDCQIARSYLLWVVDAGLHPGRPPGRTPRQPPGQLPSQRKETCEKNNGNNYFIRRNNSKWSTCSAGFAQLGFSRFDLVATTTDTPRYSDTIPYIIETLLKKQQSILWKAFVGET